MTDERFLNAVREAKEQAARAHVQLETAHTPHGRWVDVLFVLVLIGVATVAAELFAEQFGRSLGAVGFIVVAACVIVGRIGVLFGAVNSIRSLFGRSNHREGE